jgi:excisionase family DNA binding protein
VVEKLYRVEDAAREVLQLGRTRVYELVASGQIRSIAIGRARRIPESALQEFIDRQLAEQSTLNPEP